MNRDVTERDGAQWESAAEEVCKIVGTRVGAVAREVAEQFYIEVMESTQDYLAENVAFNLKSELDAARGRAERAEGILRDLRKALEEITAACEEDCTSAATEIGEMRLPDEDSVSGGELGDSKLTFGMIRRARALLSSTRKGD